MSCHGIGLLAPNRYEVELSNVALNIHFGQGAVKILEVKVRVRKILADLALTPGPKRADF